MENFLKWLTQTDGAVDTVYKAIVIVFPIVLSPLLLRIWRWIKHLVWTITAMNHATKEALANGNKDVYEREFDKKYNEEKKKYKFISKGE